MINDSGLNAAIFQKHVNFKQAVDIITKANINRLISPGFLQRHIEGFNQNVIFNFVVFSLIDVNRNRILFRVHGRVSFYTRHGYCGVSFNNWRENAGNALAVNFNAQRVRANISEDHLFNIFTA
ncbi:Uncharacterised protein [Shigella sonnei]|nr:Uncharacterised protein [Shigella sonnei]